MTPFLSWSDSKHAPFCFLSQNISSREERDDLVRSSSHHLSNKAQILAMPQFGLRDNLIRCELLKNEDLYTYLEDFRYYTSFNINRTSFVGFQSCITMLCTFQRCLGAYSEGTLWTWCTFWHNFAQINRNTGYRGFNIHLHLKKCIMVFLSLILLRLQ